MLVYIDCMFASSWSGNTSIAGLEFNSWSSWTFLGNAACDQDWFHLQEGFGVYPAGKRPAKQNGKMLASYTLINEWWILAAVQALIRILCCDWNAFICTANFVFGADISISNDKKIKGETPLVWFNVCYSGLDDLQVQQFENNLWSKNLNKK